MADTTEAGRAYEFVAQCLRRAKARRIDPGHMAAAMRLQILAPAWGLPRGAAGEFATQVVLAEHCIASQMIGIPYAVPLHSVDDLLKLDAFTKAETRGSA